MKLMENFETVSSSILSSIRGGAAALAIRQRLAALPIQHEREVPKIISLTYTLLVTTQYVHERLNRISKLKVRLSVLVKKKVHLNLKTSSG